MRGFELIEAVSHQLQLRLRVEAALGRIPQPRRGFGAGRDGGQRNEPGRAVRTVGQPGGDLAAAIPAPQDRSRGARSAGGHVERDPIRPFDLSLELDVGGPLVDPVVPVHHAPPVARPTACRPYYYQRLDGTRHYSRTLRPCLRDSLPAPDRSSCSPKTSRGAFSTTTSAPSTCCSVCWPKTMASAVARLAAAGVTLDETRKRVEHGRRSRQAHAERPHPVHAAGEEGARTRPARGPATSATTTSAPSTCCSASFVRATASGRNCSCSSTSTWPALRAQVLALVPPAAEKNRRRFWASRHRDFSARPRAADDVRTTVAATRQPRRGAAAGRRGGRRVAPPAAGDAERPDQRGRQGARFARHRPRSGPHRAAQRRCRRHDRRTTRRSRTTTADHATHRRDVDAGNDRPDAASPTRAVRLVGPDFTLRGDDDRSRGFADLWSAWDASLRATAAAIANFTTRSNSTASTGLLQLLNDAARIATVRRGGRAPRR